MTVFSTHSLSVIEWKSSPGEKDFLSWPSTTCCDNWWYRTGDTNQTGNVTISRSYVNIQNRILVWTNNSCTFLGKCRTLIRSKIHIDIYVTGGWGGGGGAVGGRQDLDVRSMFRIEFSIFQWSIRWLTLFWIRLCILKPRKKPGIISMKKFFIKNKVAKESTACKNVR